MNSNALLDEILAPGRVYAGSVVVGNRIPRDYFIARGKGESDITVHAGSYHLALRDAGIEMCNIMTYSSILPSIAREVERTDDLVHGSVMETIMAVANADRGERATAGIVYGWLHEREGGGRYGGLVCEYNGVKSEREAREQLRDSLMELYENGYSERFRMGEVSMISESFVPAKRYGTALVALCFLNYLIPLPGGERS
ncbi:MAG: pyruvoyl-dependent arginine decarboxylase [Spirochaetes bacterium]|nr:pyruvoyl-dependent arginine decarboxylase [Spirochaetota bacterium]